MSKSKRKSKKKSRFQLPKLPQMPKLPSLTLTKVKLPSVVKPCAKQKIKLALIALITAVVTAVVVHKYDMRVVYGTSVEKRCP